MIPTDDGNEFSAIPFVSGALIGRRTFRLRRRSDGIHLFGPVYNGDWITNDVNHAECLSLDKGKTPPHRAASKVCPCGYWAYFSEVPEIRNYRATYRPGLCIDGIIFGFGLCSAGERGFRCEKARIKALVVPSDLVARDDLDVPAQEELLYEAMDKYQDGSDFRWYGTYEAAVRDWPLSSAQKYGLLSASGDAAA